MTYYKPWKSYEQQLEQLIERGLLVTNESRALDYLQRIGYYRLSGYWYPFRELSGNNKGDTDRIVLDQFKPDASFENAVHLYVFDKKLRLLTLDALERIEVALRVDISHTLGQQHCFGYLKPELFDEKFSIHLDNRTGLTRHHQWLSRHAAAISRPERSLFSTTRENTVYLWQYGLLVRSGILACCLRFLVGLNPRNRMSSPESTA